MNTVGKSGKQDNSEALKVAHVCVCVYLCSCLARVFASQIYIYLNFRYTIHTYVHTYVSTVLSVFTRKKKGEAEPAIIEDHNPVGLDLAVF